MLSYGGLLKEKHKILNLEFRKAKLLFKKFKELKI